MPSSASTPSSRQTSVAASSASSYVSTPSPSAQQYPGARSNWMSSSPISKSSKGYVSPYPPVQSTSSPANPSASSSGVRTVIPTTSSSRPGQDEEKEEADQSDLKAQKRALIEALAEHRINTIGELRRVERIFASLGSSDLTQPMTAAWLYYVQSNSLLTELRALTRNYPFSSACLDEGKRLVYEDPVSNRSWNYCWLVLAKIHTERLIPTYARAQAAQPTMWGGRTPDAASIQRLAEAFVQEWQTALTQLLNFWERPPIRSSS